MTKPVRRQIAIAYGQVLPVHKSVEERVFKQVTRQLHLYALEIETCVYSEVQND